MNKIYTRINWKNYPSLETPINEGNLNNMDYTVDQLDNRIISLDNTKVNIDDVQNNIKSWTMDEETGVITITKYNNTQVIFDLNIEKIPVNFSMDDKGIITMATADGTKYTTDISTMIPILTFNDSETIKVTITGSGKDKTYSFSIIDHSITDDMIQANYLADITTQANNAEASATRSYNYSVEAKSWAVGETGTREGEDTDNAKHYAQQAEDVAKNLINDEVTTNDRTYSSNKIVELIGDIPPITNIIDDTKVSTSTTYSSDKLNKKIGTTDISDVGEDVTSAIRNLADEPKIPDNVALVGEGEVEPTDEPTYLTSSDIADNLVTSDSTKVLSARQGKVLNDKVVDVENDVKTLNNDIKPLVDLDGNYSNNGISVVFGSAIYQQSQSTIIPFPSIDDYDITINTLADIGGNAYTPDVAVFTVPNIGFSLYARKSIGANVAGKCIRVGFTVTKKS